MNYQKIYNKLVEYRKQHPAFGYTERHHIVPRSMGGSDDPSNLVVLTGREHWVAHLLLWKVYRNSQTIHACHMMAMRCKLRGIPKVRSSRIYETLRIEHAKVISERHKLTHRGEGNSQYATRWICHIELQQNKKISKDEEIPDGWISGRNKWNKINRDLERLKKREEKKRKFNTLREDRIFNKTESDSRKLWEHFKTGDFASLRDFSRYIGINIMTLQKRFKKYITSDEYSQFVNKTHSDKTKQRISNSRNQKIITFKGR